MNLGLTQEQEVLRKAARDFIKAHLPKPYAAEILRYEQDSLGYDPSMWREMADLGWMGCTVPSEYGGVGLSTIDLAIILEELGRACVPGPFLPTVVTAMVVLEKGSEEQKSALLPGICNGELILTSSLGGYTAAFVTQKAMASAVREYDSFTLTGTEMFVPYAHTAAFLLIPASIYENGALTAFLVKADTPNLDIDVLSTTVGDMKCMVTLDNVKLDREWILGTVNQGASVIQRALEYAVVGKCAEMVGGAAHVLDMTVQYAKERVQFDKPIGSFQSIQHYCANMAIDVDISRYLTYEAAWALGEGIPCSVEVSTAKAWLSDAYQRVVRLGSQIHGAIGFTMDHDMQLYYRRAQAAALDLGDVLFHKKVLAGAIGL